MTAEQELFKRFYGGLVLWIILITASLTIIVLSLIFRKRIIAYNNRVSSFRAVPDKGFWLYITLAVVAVGCAFFTYKLIPHFQDLSAVKAESFEVFTGEVIGYAKVNYGTDSGTTYKNPKIKDSEGKTIVLNLKYWTTELNKTYTFIYLKHTRLAVVKESIEP